MNQRNKSILLPLREKVGIGRMRGFTLLELLIVVIIVAVLAAVALPQYKRAALKSRFSTVMPIAKAIADANEVYYLGRNMYAIDDEKEELDVSVPGDTTVELANANQEGQYAYVAASRTDVPGARYIMYQAHSPMFAGTIQCEANENNEDALWLCEKGLNGTEIPGSINTAAGEYKTFLLEGATVSSDKLPTSIYKLKAQICANISDDNCIVDEENNTITSYTCEVPFSGGYDVECNGTKYDSEGNVLYNRSISCGEGTQPSADKESCVGIPTRTGASYEEIYEDKFRFTRSCSELSSGKCTKMSLDKIEFADEGRKNFLHLSGYACNTSDIQPDRTCSSYLPTSNPGSENEVTYTGVGQSVAKALRCTHRDTNGTCISLKNGYMYDSQNVLRDVSCSSSPLSDTNPCTEYRISVNYNNSFCPANKFDIETFECAS